ncbi:GDP-mannose 4,6-dehydratase [uncultured Methanolobus sp.]|uniref:GDP-mannose 4,6-dehydratase n=1 Tax=uncultured Methanolobus sp. TaxID=218300 RepID=UPI002AAAD949|nr:GDP-mannose 4,6-dehydratase [uncultured Methanolobus sp.]
MPIFGLGYSGDYMNPVWKNKNVFVTGATGLVGSWLTKFLLDQEANVTALVRDHVPKSILWSSSPDFDYISDKLNVVNGDLENYMLLERALNEYEIEVVFHLGAQTIVGIANRNPLSTFESNIRGTYNLLEAGRRNPSVKCIVVASSDKAYGEQEILPYSEDTPLQGTHPYDVSKSCTDLLSYTYYNTYKLPVCITRCGNFYGPGDLNFNRIIPGTIRSLLNDEKPVIRSDGTFIRDYFYVKDGALAYMMLAEKILEDRSIHGEAFNFSTESQITVLDLVNRIIEQMKPGTEPVILNEARNEIKNQYLCAEKARNILEWESKYTLESSLAETIEWYRQMKSD